MTSAMASGSPAADIVLDRDDIATVEKDVEDLWLSIVDQKVRLE